MNGRVEMWRLAVDCGVASSACDLIVHERPVPDRLFVALGLPRGPWPPTGRELQVLDLVGEGLCNQQIADRLAVSLETVKSHVANVLRKLNARDRTHAVRLAIREGLLEA